MLKYNRAYAIDLFVVVLFTLFLLLPFYVGGSNDDEGLWVSILSTKLVLSSWHDLAPPFWTNQLGFGIPLPFSHDFTLHPLSMLFLLDNLYIAVSLLYTVHFLIGAFSIFLLCKQFSIDRAVSLVCVLTFLFSSASIDYVHGNFWPTPLISWTISPLILLIYIRILNTKDSKHLFIMSILLGYIGGFWILNSALGATIIMVFGLLFFTIFCIKNAISKYKYLILSLVIVLLISANKIYYVFTEMQRFDSALEHFGNYYAFGFDKIWVLVFKPFFYISIKEFISTIQTHGLINAIMDIKDTFVVKNLFSRNSFIGAPFFLLSFYFFFVRRKIFPYQWAFAGAMIICLILTFLPPNAITSIPSSNYQYRDPYTLFAIIVSGVALTQVKMRLGMLRKKYFKLIISAQVMFLLIGSSVLLYRSFVSTDLDGSSDPKISRTYLGFARDKGLVNYLRSVGVSSTARIYLSPGSSVGRRLWVTERGNGLALQGLTVANGCFKGISTALFCPDKCLMAGEIKGQSDVIKNKDLLDVLAIRYVIATPYEIRDPSLIKIGSFSPYEGFELDILKNEDAWPLAVFIDDKAVNLRLPRRESCEHTRLLCADFSDYKKLRKLDKELILRGRNDEITITTDSNDLERTVLMSIMYMPGWVIQASSGKFKASKSEEGLVTFKIPSGETKIILSYEPLRRIALFYLFCVMMAMLPVLCIITIFLKNHKYQI